MTTERHDGDEYPNLEIRERCVRDTPNDQLWEAYAVLIGPTVQTSSRKTVRGEAAAAWKALHGEKAQR